MHADLTRELVLVAAGFTGYVVLMATQPTRRSLRDGWRCVVRYKRLLVVPFVFGACHAAFGLIVRLDESRNIPGAPPFASPWTGWQPWHADEIVRQAWLPTAESAASIFNCVTTTFPLSAVWGLLFVCNWRGYQALLGRGLRRHFGVWVGTCAQAAMVTCAVTACVKPVLFGKFTWASTFLDEQTLLRAGEGINWLSFLFEYVIGVAVQVYLLLLAFTWIRGLDFDIETLRRFAVRRWVLVSQWAGALLLVSSAGINLPLLLANSSIFPGFSAASAARWVTGTRWFLAALLITFCSVQICLVFHNGNLWHAVREHFALLRRFGWHIGWFLAVAAIHCFALTASNLFFPQVAGEWTWPALCWKALIYPLLWAGVSAWLLSSWVCLFRRCEAGQPEMDELAEF